MAFGNSSNFENIVYCYIIKNPDLYDKVDFDFFHQPVVRALYKVSQTFYKRFKETVYNHRSPHIGQIEVLVNEDKDNFQLDANMTKEENVTSFLANASVVIGTNLQNYSEEWLEQTISAWVTWQNNQKGYKEAIAYQQTQNVTPENILKVIQHAREIVIRRSNVLVDEGDVYDFFDPETHVQVPMENLIDTGYDGLNEMLCGDKRGGALPGMLSIFVGGANVGKSVILCNIAKNIAFSGKNVLFISLEMDIQSLYKRIGSNVFDMPMSEYDNFTSDKENFSLAMRTVRESSPITPGKFYGLMLTKATPSEIFAQAVRLQDRFGIKWHAIVLDYMTELGNDHGVAPDNMYQYHKTNANDLFVYARDLEITVFTAHQMRISNIGKADITFADLGESSAISHRSPSLIGLIQTPQMALVKEQYWKNMKARLSPYKDHYLRMSVDFNHMRIRQESELIPPEQYNVI